MPHVSDVAATSHDRHDPMLVAALAAGDLAGTERDQAIALTRSCTECAALHADLVGIAKATTALPPPMTTPARDFRLTPEQAAGLRRTGWRRFVPAGASRGSLTRPLGVALATFGIAGLLIGSLPIGFGSSAGAAPAAGSAVSEPSNRENQEFVSSDNGSSSGVHAAGPAASAAAASEAPAAAPAASALPVADASLGSVPDTQGGGFGSPPQVGIARSPAASAADVSKAPGGAIEAPAPEPAAATLSWSPLIVLSILAIVLGVGLLFVARRRENRPG